MNSICFNGQFLPADQPIFTVDNRGFRFGDGIFESMKVINEEISLESFHMERLFTSLNILKIVAPSTFNVENIRKDILQLCKENNCSRLAKVRLSVSRIDAGAGPANGNFQYLVECWPLEDSTNQLNETGLSIDIFNEGRKFADFYSPLKTPSFLLYVAATDFVKEKKLDDCLLLNQFDHLAESTMANLFIIKDKTIYTPGIKEGCINGVMRRYLLHSFKQSSYNFSETAITINDLENADEVFLTNAVRGIRWVKNFRQKEFGNNQTQEIYKQFIQTLF